MSAIIELEDRKTEISSNGNDVESIKPYLFTVEIYDEMIRKGLLTENDNVELLNGRIIKKMPKGKKHSSYNDGIARFFYKNIDENCVIRNQNPIWLSEISEPEPDVVLAKLPRDKYLENHPKPEDILLLIEISDSTLSLDKNAKSRMYASAEIIQYLVVDVANKSVIDYRKPFEDEYQSKQTYKIGESFSLVEFPKIKISVEEFFKS